MNFIKNNQEYFDCMQEASEMQFPRAIRQLFSCLLIYENPLYPENIWKEFKKHMYEDFERTYRNQGISEKQLEDLALQDIDTRLQSMGKKLSDFPNMPHTYTIYAQFPNNELDDTIDPELEAEHARNEYNRMYEEQKLVFDHIEQLIERPTPKDEKVIFINGQAGSGKSFVLQAIDSYIRGKRLNIINMSNVGVAAMILRDGRTVHNVFKLPVPVHYDSLARIMPGTKAWNEIKTQMYSYGMKHLMHQNNTSMW
jgi:hypothetical protein